MAKNRCQQLQGYHLPVEQLSPGTGSHRLAADHGVMSAWLVLEKWMASAQAVIGYQTLYPFFRNS